MSADHTEIDVDPVSDSEIQDLIEGPDATFHPILQVWREVLLPATTERHARITGQWANRIVSGYQGVTFQDMPEYSRRYFDKVEELLSMVAAEIETDDECLNVTSPEEDAAQNSVHYLNLLTDWQIVILGWELDWDCTDPAAGVELATISEVHRMFFGENGLTALLDQIKFEFTDMHRDALALALQTYKDSREEG